MNFLKILKTFFPKFLILLIILIGAFECFYNLGSQPVEKWDEGVYIDVVQSTISSNQFVSQKIYDYSNQFDDLTFNNNNFFEKPPLWFWVAVPSAKIFGLNAVTLRMISAVSGFLLLLSILYFCKKYFSLTVAIFAGLTFCTTGHLFLFNPDGIFSSHHIRSISLDILQLLFIFITFIFCVRYSYSKSKKDLIWIGIFTGLAFMAKGVFAILTPAIFLLFYFVKILKKEENTKTFLKQIFYIFLPFLIIVLPWHIYMSINFGEKFWDNYLGYHNLTRAFNAIESHQEAWYFHVVNLFRPQFFLSGPILFGGMIYIILKKKYRELKYFMFLVYTILILIIVTLIQTKLAWYALYVYPPAALICGIFYAKIFEWIKSFFPQHDIIN